MFNGRHPSILRLKLVLLELDGLTHHFLAVGLPYIAQMFRATSGAF